MSKDARIYGEPEPSPPPPTEGMRGERTAADPVATRRKTLGDGTTVDVDIASGTAAVENDDVAHDPD